MDTQYRIIAAGAGWAEKVSRGRLRFDGADRASFLHDLVTNDIAALVPGTGAYALYLTPQGRMIADLHVFVRPDCLVADAPAPTTPALAETFDQLVFSEDVRVTDCSSAIRQYTVVGGRAAEAIGGALRVPADAVRGLPLWAQADAGSGFVVRTDDADEGSWDILLDARDAGAAAAAFEAAGVPRVPAALLESMRIDAGRPRFGVDMDAATIPLEAGLLDRAISQTKGCYVGQEVIARVLHRGGGRVARRLVRLVCDEGGPTVPAAGALVTAGGREAGHVTSAAWSARLGRGVALAYLSRDAADAGGAVTLTWPGGEARATCFTP